MEEDFDFDVDDVDDFHIGVLRNDPHDPRFDEDVTYPPEEVCECGPRERCSICWSKYSIIRAELKYTEVYFPFNQIDPAYQTISVFNIINQIIPGTDNLARRIGTELYVQDIFFKGQIILGNRAGSDGYASNFAQYPRFNDGHVNISISDNAGGDGTINAISGGGDTTGGGGTVPGVIAPNNIASVAGGDGTINAITGGGSTVVVPNVGTGIRNSFDAQVRVCIVYDSQPTSSNPSYSDLFSSQFETDDGAASGFESPQIFEMYNFDNRDRFRFIYDETFSIGTFHESMKLIECRPSKCYFPLKVIYQGGGGAIVKTGKIYLVWMSSQYQKMTNIDGTLSDIKPWFGGRSRVIYTDE